MEFNESVLLKREHADDVKPAAEESQWMTVHCGQCNAVLSDSSCVCGESPSLDSIMCLKVTDDVIVTDVKKLGHAGDLVNWVLLWFILSVYTRLKCGGCSCTLGKVIHAAPFHLSILRSFFLLSKANVSCYVLNSGQMVKSSVHSFDQKPFIENMNQTKQTFETTLDRMSSLKTRIVERNAFREQK